MTPTYKKLYMLLSSISNPTNIVYTEFLYCLSYSCHRTTVKCLILLVNKTYPKNVVSNRLPTISLEVRSAPEIK
jgi:hypothetical protein